MKNQKFPVGALVRARQIITGDIYQGLVAEYNRDGRTARILPLTSQNFVDVFEDTLTPVRKESLPTDLLPHLRLQRLELFDRFDLTKGSAGRLEQLGSAPPLILLIGLVGRRKVALFESMSGEHRTWPIELIEIFRDYDLSEVEESWISSRRAQRQL